MGDFYGFVLTVLIASAVGFMMGRSARKDGRTFADDLSRFVDAGRPLPSRLKGMEGLLMAMFALFLSLFLFGVAARSYNPGLQFLGVLCFLSYWLLVPVWVYRDARARGGRAWAWGLMTLCTNVLGLFSYLITRPEQPRTCRRCGYKLREEFIVCPYCGPQAGRACTNCQQTLEPDWLYCPYCQTPAVEETGSAPLNASPYAPIPPSDAAPQSGMVSV